MQPTVKISNLPKQSAPAITDKAPIVHGSETDYALLSDLITLFFNNIPTGVIPGLTFDYVISGGVWTADSVGVNRNASMSTLSVYLGQRSIPITNVAARTFTASKDTYVDVLSNLDGTGTLVYTEVANNAASPALAANSVRIGIIVTGATTIAAAGSINQGEETKLLPIASSTPYSTVDSLGNLICSRDPQHRILGERRITLAFTGSSATFAAVTGLSCPIIAPTGRKLKATVYGSTFSNNTTLTTSRLAIYTGASLNALTTALPIEGQTLVTGTNAGAPIAIDGLHTPSLTSLFFTAAYDVGGGTATFAGGDFPFGYIRIELA